MGKWLSTISLFCELPICGQGSGLIFLSAADMRRRFLRAHNFDIEKTIHRFHAVQEWRRTHDMERAYRYMDVEIFEDYRAMVSSTTS